MQPEPLNPQVPPETFEQEAQLLVAQDSNDKLGNIEQLNEAQAVEQTNTTQAVRDLEPALEAIMVNTEPKEVQNIRIVPSEDKDDSEWNENQAGKAFWNMLRGPKGHTPTTEELVALIEPLIPAPLQGDKGLDADPLEIANILFPELSALVPKKEDILAEIVVPEPIKGDPGLPGKNGDDGYTPKKGVDYFDGEPGENGSPDTPEQILKKIKGKYSWKDLKDKPDLANRPGGGGGQNIAVLSNGTQLTALLQSLDFVGATLTQASDGVITVTITDDDFTELPATGTVNSSNQDFTFTQKPSYIVRDGAWYKEESKSGNVNWTWNAGTLTATMQFAPQDDIFGIK